MNINELFNPEYELTDQPEATETQLSQVEEIEEKLNPKQYFYALLGESKRLSQVLKDNVRGQEEAISRFVQGCFHSDLFPVDEGKGVTTKFVFGGPVGVGKSSLAEAAAEALEVPFLKIELSDSAADSSAVSLAQSIINEGEDCELSDIEYFVKEFPQCVIMFNDLEKAHPKVLGALTKLFKNGSIINHKEKLEISFKDVIFIFTTNLGLSLYSGDGDRNITGLPKAVVMDALRQELAEIPTGEIINNFLYDNFATGNIIMFNGMSIYHLTEIVAEGFESFQQKLQENYNLKLNIDPQVISLFLYTHCHALDAHSARPESHIFLKNELYEFGRHFRADSDSFNKLEQFTLKVKVPPKGDALRSLFVYDEPLQLLVIGDPKKYSYLRDSDKIEFNFARSYDKALEILKKKDILYAVIDLYYGGVGKKSSFLSLDDIGSKGVSCFDKLSRQLTDIPIFLMDAAYIDTEDKATFLQRGARQFINLETEPEQAMLLLEKLAQSLYMQAKVYKLASRGKILGFNSAQKLSKDGKRVEITFYDFYTRNNQTRQDFHLDFVEELQTKKRFADITGAVSAKKELQQLSSYLLNPRRFVLEEGNPPKGILLFGWKETGKAALARALAGESNAAFLHLNSSILLAQEPGNAMAIISQMFRAAKKCAPAVIFFEDLEKIIVEDNPLKEIISQVLLDNIKDMNSNIRTPVLFVGSVDYPYPNLSMIEDKLNQDVLHVMEYRIFVNMPNRDERKEFIEKELVRLELKGITEKSIQNIAERTHMTSISRLRDFLNFAARRVRKASKEDFNQVFIGALDEFQMGEAREASQAEKVLHTAYHEAGHAYLNWYNGNEATFMTIVSRGNYGGYYMSKIDENKGGMTKRELLDRIRMCLAGRGAELVFLGNKDGMGTGISSDLENATNIALSMICYYGMDEDSLLSLSPSVALQGPFGEKVLNRASELLQREMKNTIEILEQGKAAVEALAEKLAANNYLTGEEIDAFLEGYKELRRK